jgi:hypothetical protein
VKDQGLNATTGPIMYVPVAQVQNNVLPFYSQACQAFRLMWVVRTKTAPFSLTAEIQRRPLVLISPPPSLRFLQVSRF